MINSFANEKLEKCWREDDCKGIDQTLRRRVQRKLDLMDAATCLEDLKNPPGNDLHRLKGDLDGYWAIRVNGPWRLIFRYEDNNIDDVDLVQYH